jgi:hypothetical protein
MSPIPVADPGPVRFSTPPLPAALAQMRATESAMGQTDAGLKDFAAGVMKTVPDAPLNLIKVTADQATQAQTLLDQARGEYRDAAAELSAVAPSIEGQNGSNAASLADVLTWAQKPTAPITQQNNLAELDIQLVGANSYLNMTSSALDVVTAAAAPSTQPTPAAAGPTQ